MGRKPLKYYVSLSQGGTKANLSNFPELEKYLVQHNDAVMHNIEQMRKPKDKRFIRNLSVFYSHFQELVQPIKRLDNVKDPWVMIIWITSLELMRITRQKKLFYFTCPECGHTTPETKAKPDIERSIVRCRECGCSRIQSYFTKTFK